MPTSGREEPFLSTSQVSKWLGIAPRTLCLWAECAEIPATKIGRQWRFRPREIKRWLEERGVKSESPLPWPG